MKHAYWTIKLSAAAGFVLLAVTALAQVGTSAMQSVSLDGSWEFPQGITDKSAPEPVWLPAQVPGDIHLDLLKNNLIPDPYYRDNESQLQWIEKSDWTYRKSFPVTAELLAHRRLDDLAPAKRTP